MQSGTAEDTDAEAADAEDELAVGSFSLLMACFATRQNVLVLPGNHFVLMIKTHITQNKNTVVPYVSG